MYHTGRQLITLHARQDVSANACGEVDMVASADRNRRWLDSQALKGSQ
jgi:hypothetical protein